MVTFLIMSFQNNDKCNLFEFCLSIYCLKWFQYFWNDIKKKAFWANFIFLCYLKTLDFSIYAVILFYFYTKLEFWLQTKGRQCYGSVDPSAHTRMSWTHWRHNSRLVDTRVHQSLLTFTSTRFIQVRTGSCWSDSTMPQRWEGLSIAGRGDGAGPRHSEGRLCFLGIGIGPVAALGRSRSGGQGWSCSERSPTPRWNGVCLSELGVEQRENNGICGNKWKTELDLISAGWKGPN